MVLKESFYSYRSVFPCRRFSSLIDAGPASYWTSEMQTCLLNSIKEIANLSQDVCAICREDWKISDYVVRLPCCKIVLDMSCFLQWVKGSSNLKYHPSSWKIGCPHCRAILDPEHLIKFLPPPGPMKAFQAGRYLTALGAHRTMAILNGAVAQSFEICIEENKQRGKLLRKLVERRNRACPALSRAQHISGRLKKLCGVDVEDGSSWRSNWSFMRAWAKPPKGKDIIWPRDCDPMAEKAIQVEWTITSIQGNRATASTTHLYLATHEGQKMATLGNDMLRIVWWFFAQAGLIPVRTRCPRVLDIEHNFERFFMVESGRYREGREFRQLGWNEKIEDVGLGVKPWLWIQELEIGEDGHLSPFWATILAWLRNMAMEEIVREKAAKRMTPNTPLLREIRKRLGSKFRIDEDFLDNLVASVATTGSGAEDGNHAAPNSGHTSEISNNTESNTLSGSSNGNNSTAAIPESIPANTAGEAFESSTVFTTIIPGPSNAFVTVASEISTRLKFVAGWFYR